MTYRDATCPICKEVGRVHGSESGAWIDAHIFEKHPNEWIEIAKITDKAHEMSQMIYEKYGIRSIGTRIQYRSEANGIKRDPFKKKEKRPIPEGHF